MAKTISAKINTKKPSQTGRMKFSVKSIFLKLGHYKKFHRFTITLTLDKIILLQKYFSEPTLSTRIILEIKFVKAMKGAFVSMHVQQIYIKIIPAITESIKTRARKL